MDSKGRIIGVASRGIDECGPAIYGAVSAWRDWIIEVAVEAYELGRYEAPEWLVQVDPDLDGVGSGTVGVFEAEDGELLVGPQGLTPVDPSAESDPEFIRLAEEKGCSLTPLGQERGDTLWALAVLCGLALVRRLPGPTHRVGDRARTSG